MSSELLEILRQEKKLGQKGGIYHKTQIALCYNSNRIEGSRLSEEQTRMIFETKTIGGLGGPAHLDDAIHAENHFRCFDYVLDCVDKELSVEIIKV